MPTINRLTKTKKRTYTSPQRELRAKYYSSAMWRELRIAKLNNNPLCEVCESNNIITPANQVHHITSPFQFADCELIGAYFFDYQNLQSICATCHGREHSHTR